MAPRLLDGRLLRGCNIHHRTTVFAQRVDPGLLSGRRPLDAGADFAARFIERFGGLASSSPGGSLPEATRAALAGEPGLTLSEGLLAAVLAVERCVVVAMGRPDEPRFSRIVEHDGVIELVWETSSPRVSRAAALAAFTGLVELLPPDLGGGDPEPGFETLLSALRRRCRRRQWSRTAAVLAQAARHRGLPHEVLASNYLRLGEGVVQQVVSESVLGVAAPGQGDAILDRLFPPGVAARIPTALVVGERGTRSIARALDRLLRTSHRGVGLATRDRTTIQGQRVDPLSLGRRAGPEFLLGDPRVDVVVGADSPRKVVARGLRLDRCSVVALLDPAAGGDLEVDRACVEVSLAAATNAIVIGAGHPHAELVLRAADPARVLLVVRRGAHPLAERHLAAGGSVVQLTPGGDGEAIAWIGGRNASASIPLSSLRPRQAQHRRRGTRTALFTAALAFALRLPQQDAGVSSEAAVDR